MVNTENQPTKSQHRRHIKILTFGLLLTLGGISGGAVLNVGISQPASAAACTDAELAKNVVKYTMSADGGTITQNTQGKYTKTNAGRVGPSCEDYGEGGYSQIFRKVSDTEYKVSGTSCTDKLVLRSAPNSSSTSISATYYHIYGTSGRGQTCSQDPPKEVSVTIPSSGSGCQESFFIYTSKPDTLYQTSCGSNAVSVSLTRDTEDLTHYSLTGPTNMGTVTCSSSEYQARVILSRVVTNSSTGSVSGKLQVLTGGGIRGSCQNDPNNPERNIKVDLVSLDCSVLGEFADVGCLYAERVCTESLGITTQEIMTNCQKDYIQNFKSYITDCQASSSTSRENFIQCLISKAPEVTSELTALTSGDGAPTCVIDGIGWIVCPVVNFLAQVADGAFGFLADNFLRTDPQLFNTSSNVYKAWSIMRNIANVAFVIAFLIIIFSQLTSFGVSNYGVKKMLPRLVIAAILVNVSYFISQLAVDLSNILGYSIKDIFASLTGAIGGNHVLDTENISPFANGSGFAGVAGSILAAAGIGAALYVMLSALIPVILAAVVALVMILFILVARQALIILLVVVSPLAFVAFLLPNTESLFKKWQKALTALLLVFPIVALVFGASSLASSILSGTFSGGLSGDTQNWFGQIIAAAVMVLPLFVVPVILKKSLDGIGNIGGTLNKWSGRAGKGLGDAYKNSSFNKYREGAKADRKARISAGNYGGINPISRARSRLNRRLNNSRGFNLVTGGFGAGRDLSAQAQDRKDMQDAVAMFNSDDQLVSAWAQSGGDTNHAAFNNLDDAQKAQFMKMRNAGHHHKATSHLAAAQYLSENGKGSAADVQAALKHAEAQGADQTTIKTAKESAIVAYRKSGRGDAYAQLRTSKGEPTSMEQGWAEVSPESVHREGIDASNVAGRNAYKNLLESDRERTRQALVHYDSMESRARNRAESLIVEAAKRHQARETGLPSTITGIQEAKKYFGITTT